MYERCLLCTNGVTRNDRLKNLLHDLLEDFRNELLTGTDYELVLDPLEVEHVHLVEEDGSHLNIKNLVVSKLSTFVVDKLTVNSASIIPGRFRIEFDIHIPVLEVLADNYDLLVFVSGRTIYGNGQAKIYLIETRVKGFLDVHTMEDYYYNGIFLEILTSHVEASLKGFEPEINGLMNDPAMSEVINIFLKHFVPKVVELGKEEITKILSDGVYELGNDILLPDFDLAEIFG